MPAALAASRPSRSGRPPPMRTLPMRMSDARFRFRRARQTPRFFAKGFTKRSCACLSGPTFQPYSVPPCQGKRVAGKGRRHPATPRSSPPPGACGPDASGHRGAGRPTDRHRVPGGDRPPNPEGIEAAPAAAVGHAGRDRGRTRRSLSGGDPSCRSWTAGRRPASRFPLGTVIAGSPPTPACSSSGKVLPASRQPARSRFPWRLPRPARVPNHNPSGRVFLFSVPYSQAAHI